MKNKIIITGHDLGYSKAVNNGFKYLLSKDKPLFSEVTILPNAQCSKEAVEIAKESNVSLNLGFSFVNSRHISLTQRKSLLGKAPYMKNTQNVRDWDFSVINTFEDDDIEAEIQTQYQWFLENFNKKPSALVTQKGEHGDPKILEPMIRLAKKEGLPMRAPLWKWKANYGAQDLVSFEGIKTTDDIFVCFKDWQNFTGYDIETDIEKLIADIKKSKGVSEILFLPGFCDNELLDMTSISWQRGQIIAVFKQKYQLIERLYSEFEVIPYTDL